VVIPYEATIQRHSITIGSISNKSSNNILVYGTTCGEIKIFYDLFDTPITSSFKQASITAVDIGSVRNTGNNTLIVGSVDGQITLYHLEILEPFFSPDKFKGKPKELGICHLNNEMNAFHPEIEKELDPIFKFNSNTEESKVSNNDKSYCINPNITQKIKTNISIIKCKAVYLSLLNNVRTDGIFVGTSDGRLYMYVLECSSSDMRSYNIHYDTKTNEIVAKDKSSPENKDFHLMGIKSWEFTSGIRGLSFTKIYNPNKEYAIKRKRRSNSIHGSINNSLNDILICVGLSNQRMSIFNYTNQNLNEISINKRASETPILEQQLNIFVFLLS